MKHRLGQGTIDAVWAAVYVKILSSDVDPASVTEDDRFVDTIGQLAEPTMERSRAAAMAADLAVVALRRARP